ncbi:L-histidine N(alpha)-methyltransferase [Nakamurella sp.]|uniref:L-histidine N(alpha)-methyltransferase n=1 Tax=Nakamurella sp. TaxID=1869182 RepID=UPI0037842175
MTVDHTRHGYTFDDHLPADFADRSLREDVLVGLTAAHRWLPPKWFYDKVGSELFEDITRLPEYYPTRTERSILAARAREIVALAGTRTLVELGSGSSDKTRLVLDAMSTAAAGRDARPTGDDEPADYVALDVSEDALRLACAGLVAQYPDLRIAAVRADFTHQLDVLPDGPGRTVAFLGGTIGNFDPEHRAAFLESLRARLRPGDHFLLGADLVKSPQILIPAYDDAAGVTAAFNLNVLDVLNHRLGADFRRSDFTHVAVWDPVHEWIEMRLRATREVAVRIDDVGLDVRLEPGAEIRTEISAKFRRDRLTDELTAAGFTGRGWWTDDRRWFSLSLWGVR